MPFTLPDAWTWDMWFADDGQTYHVFYLKASRALGDPERRHRHPTVGHAVSENLREWREVRDALVPSDAPSFDDNTTWSGSVVRAPDGTWRMFYTGTRRADPAFVQRIGVATSADLYTWEKRSSEELCGADPLWYETYDGESWKDESWRDPWVFDDPASGLWQMLVTARANHGERDNRAVVGHATSPDLDTWTVRPPLSEPGAGFGEIEVPQVATIDGRHVLVFSCLHAEMSEARRATRDQGGVWCVPTASRTGPYLTSAATRLTDESLYAGRLVESRDGTWWLFAFHNTDEAGTFVGALSDPMPVGWAPDGRLHVTDGRFDHLA